MGTVDAFSVLRLVDRPASSSGDRFVTVSWEVPGFGQRTATIRIDVSVGDDLAELVRWYLEDYGEFPSDPAPAVAVRAEASLADLGRRLFVAVFGAGVAAEVWGQVVARGLDRVRVEVDTDPADVPGLPWELLREPASDRALVLAAGQFVRTHHETATSVVLPDPARDRLRVLLVICRPGGRQDVPFRSVASRLVRAGADALPWLELDVLRPATFARLGQALRAARDGGKPYHVVHFDGHGAYLDASRLDEELADADEDGGPEPTNRGIGVSALLYRVSLAGPQRSGRHGYLLFEDPAVDSNQQLVDGPTLANLLVRNRVPVVVLNACRSAYTEPQNNPADESMDSAAAEDGSVRGRIRAYGSLAAEIADAGVAGVVAMRYNVYVVTAGQFVADLYTHLGAGRTLGQAATTARQQLADDPTRHIGDMPVALQDWVVPTIYETAPLTLLAPAESGSKTSAVRIRLDDAGRSGSSAAGATNAPDAPDVGFFGRDETLLALDRALDTSNVVLLHALAGAGKTTTVAEFARWYATTGGLDHSTLGRGPVLWTSFEHHTPLDRVLDAVGTAFDELLEANGVHWAALSETAQRRAMALGVLAEVPVLWVWDNIEPVAGFPAGTASAWTDAEQAELLTFLRDLKTRTKAKVLLTSRRDEQPWLGLLPSRIHLPAMPMAERLQLARAIAGHLGHRASSTVDWRPLLRFTGGNPLTITVAVRQAVRENATSNAEALTAFVGRITSGRSGLETPEDAALGRSGSLAASLDYGFATAFTDTERAVLAVLHLFRDTVDVDALRFMGDPKVAGTDAVPGLAGLTRESGIALLDRAVDIGLLSGYGVGYYGLHPALPWYFHALYTRHIGPAGSAAVASERAYLKAIGLLGQHYASEIEDGRSDAAALRLEEQNLLHAADLGHRHQLPEAALSALNGLTQLYWRTGRDVEWARLAEQALPNYLTADGQPRAGLEDSYGLVMSWRVRIARHRLDITTATALQTNLVDWDNARARAHLHTASSELDVRARHLLRELAVSEQDLGLLLYEQEKAEASLPHFQTHYDLIERIGDVSGQARAASHLGNAYLQTGDLDRAQHWHQRSLDLKPTTNPVGRAASYGSLANVAYAKFAAARAAGAQAAELLDHLKAAIAGHSRALDLLPPDHHDFRAVAHHQLGNLYTVLGETSVALRHYQQSVQHDEARGDTFLATNTRYDIALLLRGADRAADALHYARAAHATYLALGPGAATNADKAAALIRDLEQSDDPRDPNHP